MILLGEHKHDRRLIAKRLPPMRRHISQLCVLPVAFEDSGHCRLHIGRGPRLFGGRQRFSSTKQRHIETDVQARWKHSLGFIRLARFANRSAVLQLYFSRRIFPPPSHYLLTTLPTPTL